MLYHAFGAGVLGASLNRGHSLLLEDGFDAERFLDLIETRRITSAPLVPTLMVRLAKLDDAAFTGRDLSSLQWIAHTAAPCPPWAKQRLIDGYASRHGLAGGDLRLRALDLQYHDIARDRSPFYKLQSRGLVERMCLDEDIETAIDTAPKVSSTSSLTPSTSPICRRLSSCS